MLLCVLCGKEDRRGRKIEGGGRYNNIGQRDMEGKERERVEDDRIWEGEQEVR